MNQKKFVLFFLLMVVGLFSITNQGQSIKPRKSGQAAPVAEAQSEPENQAKDLYFASTPTGESKAVGLRVKLYQWNQNCEFRLVSPSQKFRAGDRLRIGVETNTSGYLYIVLNGSSDETSLLFPMKEINNGDNRIVRGAELVVPNQRWFEFDKTQGTEELVFILSKKRMDMLPYLIPAGNSIPDVPQVGSTEGEVLAILQGQSSSKDLVYSESTSSQVSSASSSGFYNAVYAVNANPRKNDFCLMKLKLQHR